MTPAWPAPEVPARVAEPAEIPTGARRVAALAAAAGWTVVATYARGTYPGRVPRVVDCLALRMWRGRQRAVALWHGVKFQFACAWGETAIRTYNVTQLRAVLAEGGRA